MSEESERPIPQIEIEPTLALPKRAPVKKEPKVNLKAKKEQKKVFTELEVLSEEEHS